MTEATWLDRTIGWLAPQRGLRRVQARKLTESLSYEGARAGRRTDGWVTTSSSADTEVQATIGSLRNRARDLVRNNPHAARAIDVKVSNTIGTGIVGEVENRTLLPLWKQFIDECDADGNLDLFGLQALIERTRSESGEALVRFIPSSTKIPFQLRVLEPDYIDDARHGAIGGNQIRYGIEYDQRQLVVAYWLFDQHPGDQAPAMGVNVRSYESFRVPASEIIHLYRKQRAGQTRGVTDFAPVMLRMRDLDDYDDAEMMRKKIEACLAAFVTSPQGADAARLGPVTTDTTGRVEQLFPGMVEYLRAGEDVKMADPRASGGYADFQRFGLRSIAAGYGVPYELMTGDLSQVNYSSYRAGLVDFRRRIEQDQWLMHVPQVCRRIERRFRDEVSVIAPGAGLRSSFDWTPPRFELIDPLKETQADLEACLAGFDSWDEIVRRRGWGADEQLDLIGAWQKKLDDRGIILKSDFRTQMTPAPTNSEPEGDDDEESAA